MADLDFKVNWKCLQWDNESSSTCVEFDATLESAITPIILAIFVIVVLSLFLGMGSVLASSYLIRRLRQDNRQQTDECHCNCHRKSTPTQYDTGTQQLPLLGLAKTTELAESRDRSASSPNIILPSQKTPPEVRVDYENTIGRDSPKKPRRSNSVPQRRLVKKWPGVRFTRKSDQPDQTPKNASRNKSKILKGSATPSNLLKNMHDITYELTGKGDFQPPSQEKKGNTYVETDQSPLVISSGEEKASPDDPQPPNTSGANGNPVYYTLEVTNDSDDSDAENEDANKPSMPSSSKESSDKVTLFAPYPHKLDEVPILSRSMSDAFEMKRKKPSFRIVSSKSSKKSQRKVVNSATWNARELVKNKIMLQQEREQQPPKSRRRASEVYEDIENDCADGLSRVSCAGEGVDSKVDAAEIPGSYSLLSRSLEDGLAGCGNKVNLAGYQQLSVGGPEHHSGPEISAGMMV